MRKFALYQLGVMVNKFNGFSYRMRPTVSGFVIIRYKTKFHKFFWKKFDELDIDLSYDSNMNVLFGTDNKLDFVAYSNYCAKGFNDNPMDDDMLDLLNAASGLAEEASEIMSVVRKFVFHNKPFKLEDFASEAGDMTWFFANLLRIIGLPLSDVLRANKIKLDIRYPEGRNKNYKLNIRDKDKEKYLVKKLLEESGAYDTYNKNNRLKNHAN